MQEYHMKDSTAKANAVDDTILTNTQTVAIKKSRRFWWELPYNKILGTGFEKSLKSKVTHTKTTWMSQLASRTCLRSMIQAARCTSLTFGIWHLTSSDCSLTSSLIRHLPSRNLDISGAWCLALHTSCIIFCALALFHQKFFICDISSKS